MKKSFKVAMFFVIIALSSSIYAGQGVLVKFVNHTRSTIEVSPAPLDPSNPDSYRDWWYENDLGVPFSIAPGALVERYTETKISCFNYHDGIIRVNIKNDSLQRETVMEIFTGNMNDYYPKEYYHWYKPTHVKKMISVIPFSSYFFPKLALSYGFTSDLRWIFTDAYHIEFKGVDMILIQLDIFE